MKTTVTTPVTTVDNKTLTVYTNSEQKNTAPHQGRFFLASHCNGTDVAKVFQTRRYRHFSRRFCKAQTVTCRVFRRLHTATKLFFEGRVWKSSKFSFFFPTVPEGLCNAGKRQGILPTKQKSKFPKEHSTVFLTLRAFSSTKTLPDEFLPKVFFRQVLLRKRRSRTLCWKQAKFSRCLARPLQQFVCLPPQRRWFPFPQGLFWVQRKRTAH